MFCYLWARLKTRFGKYICDSYIFLSRARIWIILLMYTYFECNVSNSSPLQRTPALLNYSAAPTRTQCSLGINDFSVESRYLKTCKSISTYKWVCIWFYSSRFLFEAIIGSFMMSGFIEGYFTHFVPPLCVNKFITFGLKSHSLFARFCLHRDEGRDLLVYAQLSAL